MSGNQCVAGMKRHKKNQRRTAKKISKAKRSEQRQRNRQYAKRVLNCFFDDSHIFDEYRFHGNIDWLPLNLAQFALLFFWSEKKNVTDAFTETFKRAGQMGIAATHTTYQGFMGALSNYVHVFMSVLIAHLQRKILDAAVDVREVSGMVPIAFDGSRNSAARTTSNERELCSDKGKQKAAESPSSVTDPRPQAWITMMWHMGTRLPWNWRLGPSDSSERRHVQEMLEEDQFPENTLFVGDAGFVGYDFWRSITDRGYHFMVRVGNNVRLLGDSSDYRQEGDEVLCWPREKQSGHPPLRLRLVQLRVGKANVYLLTSLLSSKQLCGAAMSRLYEMRWGVEVGFRGLKQTRGKAKLRCHNVNRVYTELHWHLLSTAIGELAAVMAQRRKWQNEKSGTAPDNRSLAGTMRAIHDCLDHLLEFPAVGDDLFSRLSHAVTDNYQRTRSKQARFKPRVAEKKKNKPKAPKIRKMTAHEERKLKTLQRKVTV